MKSELLFVAKMAVSAKHTTAKSWLSDSFILFSILKNTLTAYSPSTLLLVIWLMNTQVVLTVVDGLIPRVENLAKTKMNHNQHRDTTKQPPRITEQPKHSDIHHYRPSNEQRSKIMRSAEIGIYDCWGSTWAQKYRAASEYMIVGGGIHSW